MDTPITRSALLTTSFQIEGLCIALRLIVQTHITAGKGTRSLLTKVLKDFKKMATGIVIEEFPDLSDDSNEADLLAIAETLRTSILCFLTEEERGDRKKTFGFTND